MPSKAERSGGWGRVLVLGVLFALATSGIATRALWDLDEGMHAAMSRAMVDSGDWLTPRFNGEPFFDKPVLFTWLGALSMSLLGFTELAARLPGALLGLGTVLLTYVLGRRVYGPRAGLVGATALATSGGFVLFSSVVVHDICLTFFFTLCMALLHFAIEDERRRTLLFLLASAAAGLAVLSKGPLGVVLPAGITLCYLVMVGRPGLLRRLPLARGLLVFLAVSAPWYVLMARAHPDYLRHFFIGQNVGYFVSSESRHVKPFWTYAPVLLALLAPWSFFLPAALVTVRPARSTPRGRATLLLLLWAGVTLVFFSIARSKLPGYILPSLPPLALLVGIAWSRLEADPRARARRHIVAGSTACFSIALGAAVYLQGRPPVRVQERFGIEPGEVTSMMWVLALALGVSLALLLIRRAGAALSTLALTVVGLFVAFSVHFAPMIDIHRSAKALAPRLEQRLDVGQDLVSYGNLRGNGDSLLFYTGRRATQLRDETMIGLHLDSPQRVFALVSRRHVAGMSPHGDRAWVVEREGDLMVVSNRPDEPLEEHEVRSLSHLNEGESRRGNGVSRP